MTGDQILQLLGQSVVAGIVYALSERFIRHVIEQVEDLRKELEAERQRYTQLQQQYFADLRDWSGINPRFQTWNRSSPEADTRRFAVPADVDPQEYAKQHQAGD